MTQPQTRFSPHRKYSEGTLFELVERLLEQQYAAVFPLEKDCNPS